MIVAAAQLQECALLLTEDLQDGAVFGTVTVRSPFTLDVREPGAKYLAGQDEGDAAGCERGADQALEASLA
jgi:hypothetical protein